MTTPKPGADWRCRFAPSPTGYLHVGSARTALFNWLFARATGATYVLRIEDTDEVRNRNDIIDVIFEELEWLGIDWDEGPVYQSDLRESHRDFVNQLLAKGAAYCVDGENNRVESSSILEGHAVRYGVEKGRTIAFTDAVRGDVSFETDDLEDFVIWRSNNTPTFLLANAVDDASMDITHAIRGEDLLSSTPKVQLLFEEIGVEPPTYAHLPLLVNKERKKLSKRRDDVSVGDYRRRGYLPEAMVNYLALLGWGPDDDKEIRPIQEIVEQFSIERVSKAPAFFDLVKLNHFNSTYIQALSQKDFVESIRPYLEADQRWQPDAIDTDLLNETAEEVSKRVDHLSDSVQYLDWLLLDDIEIEEKAFTKGLKKAKSALEVLDGVIEAFADCDWQADVLNKTVRAVGDDLGVKSAVPVRVAVTGKLGGIPLYGPLVHLGRERTIKRLKLARTQLAES